MAVPFLCMEKRTIDGLDLIGLLGALIGLANYQENLSQSSFAEATRAQTEEIHKHLKEQDDKISKILEALHEKN